ncbi:mndB [Candida pseudojiufengensis]|uniref:mndB n=1 Tax=Candida pseudojiufengensis TaxID=497109 RepID=UPI002225A779|nr:mndB [Candida pseudojiufengensis]KAI5963489.1 mndB [Candida pseudojiufengensis]
MSQLTEWQFRQVTPHINSTIPNLKTWYLSKPNSLSHQIHLDLLYNDLILDPFVNDNELIVNWISEVKWEYKTLFESSVNTTINQGYLILNQLDNDVKVILNNDIILQSENSFHKHIIGPINFTTNTNELRLILDSGFARGKELETKSGSKPCWNGDCSRLYVRKPQYQYGWDWGPTLLTCGFDEILVVFEPFVEDFFIRYKFNNELNIAFLNFEINTLIIGQFKFKLGKMEIFKNNQYFETLQFNKFDKFTNISYILNDVELWWPRKYGRQNLYTFKLYLNEKLMITKTTGFRKIEIITESDEFGESFYFKINNKSIQMIGSNWIPPNSFISNMTIEDYIYYLDLVVDSNQNMIRVWGGGNYENDEFYKICDELGILVWHDFMFACGIYPYESFIINNNEKTVNSIEKEIIDVLKKLRNHPSIIIYVGNNEDYQIADSLKIDQNNKTSFPAKSIYEEIIPFQISELTNNVIYRFGSPYSGTNISSYDINYGDSHQWNVWHGSKQPYQNWNNLTTRFTSEFGMLSLPSYNLLKTYITDPLELKPNSKMIKFHTKANNKENLPYYVWMNFNKPEDLDLKRWIYLTQIMQSESIELAFRYWKQKWFQNQCGGILVWQLNDCYPSISWSIIGFDQIPKLSYYGMKRELKDIVIGSRRYEGENILSNTLEGQLILSNSKNVLKFDVWGIGNNVTNSTLKMDFYTSEGYLFHQLEINYIDLKDNEVKNILQNHVFEKFNFKNDTIVSLRLITSKDEVVARSSNWPNYLKNLNWLVLTNNLNLTYQYLKNGKFKISTNKPLKKLQLYFEDHNKNEIDYIFNDNGIDLFPNDDQIIQVFNFNENDLKFLKLRYLDF